MLVVKNISKTFNPGTVNEKQALRGLSLTLADGDFVTVIGGNGAGKSTLLKYIWEELNDRRDLRAMLMPQDYSTVLDFEKTPVEYLAKHYTKEEVTKARTYMGGMKFTHGEMMGKIENLSGGQKAKILFLDMVLRRANVLVLDEPTRNFSPLSSPVVRAALKEFGGAIISVSHDRKYLEESCDKVYELREGGLFFVR